MNKLKTITIIAIAAILVGGAGSIYNFTKVGISDGSGNDVSVGVAGQMFTSDFLIEVSKGNVPGHTLDRKFGSIDSIQADTPADVWEYGVTSGAERYTFSADGVADIDTMSSSSGSDTVIMTIIGLDADGEPVTQSKALTGQTKVTLDTPLWRVNRAYNSNGIDLVGNVYIYVDGAITLGVPNDVTTVRGYVSAGEGQTLQTIYTVPAGFTAYFMGLESSITKGVGATVVTANLRGRTRDFGRVFRTQDEFTLISSGSSGRVLRFPIALPFAAKTDFCPIVDVSANDVGASWAFTILLVQDGF